jgi:hypothetical protein
MAGSSIKRAAWSYIEYVLSCTLNDSDIRDEAEGQGLDPGLDPAAFQDAVNEALDTIKRRGRS